MTAPMGSSQDRLLDQIALVDALAEYARATVERDAAQAVLVRLARRLVDGGHLTDAEAVSVAGKEALSALREKMP